MKMKTKIASLYEKIDSKFFEQFEFRICDTNLSKIAIYMHKPKDASSLAFTRILFGIAMLFDITDERGGAAMMETWGNPSICHFPLLNFLQAMPMPHMALVYAGLWFGIALGHKFRASSAIFTTCFWYLLLIEKSYWNNHSYLFGLVAFLLTFTRANCCWSVDAIRNRSVASQTVPYWNYFILKYQFFILYFMAGLKKGTAEWLTGYSVRNLSEHWVFEPFKLFLTVPQIDYLIVHWFVFAFDLTVAIWMMWSRTRHPAMVFCALFHLMNSRLFRIGMFPWVCLATMPLFYPFDWPKRVSMHLNGIYLKCKKGTCKFFHKFKKSETNVKTTKESLSLPEDDEIKAIEKEDEQTNETYLPKKVDTCTNSNEKIEGKVNDGLYVFTQAFLPFSHFITKGYNNWTDGLYGYSWDMMVHTWDVHSVVVKVVDNDGPSELFVDPYHFTPNGRWTRHGDMVHQYARCLKENLLKTRQMNNGIIGASSRNISVYVDVWSSLNGRFTQRMFDPKVDLLNVSWSPFAPVSYLMPLLDEALEWREYLVSMRETVHSWNDHADVVFIADFPGYEYEKYIPTELRNVTLTVLYGLVVFEAEVAEHEIGKSYQLKPGNSMKLSSEIFHKVLNIGEKPAFYMYTFFNSTEVENNNKTNPVPKLPITEELRRRFYNMLRFGKDLVLSLFNLFFNATQCQ
ncbi:unnamed protein product, partial [Iphiclides podalirius]